MREFWKHMVAKLRAPGVVDLTYCLSYEHLWQRCGKCNVKVTRDAGKADMTTRVLQVTNQ